MITEQIKRKQVVQKLMQKNMLVTTSLLNELQQSETLEEYYQKYCTLPTQYVIRPVHEFEPRMKKHTVQDFVGYWNTRFKTIERILKTRHELSGLTSIARLRNLPERQKVSIIGIIMSKFITKNDHISLEVEDRTGCTRVLVSKNSAAYEQGKDLMLDEIVGIVGSAGNDIVFANSLIFPDIPLREEKKAPDPGIALVLSDFHVGCDKFLGDDLDRFFDWLEGTTGTPEQQILAKKVKYIFFTGDLVEGVGIFPGQEAELDIPDIYKQYQACAKYLSRVPKDIRTIVIPGNHDAIRLSEPQPKLDKHFAGPIWDIPNVTMCTNPCTINVHSSQNFSGYDVLMYHGFSYSYYSDNVPSIRNSGRGVSDRTDLVMKYLLQRRHLAPTHGSNLYIPDPTKDGLFIETIPDFFLSGHIHKAAIAKYRGTDLICGSCWQSQSAFQKKMGHIPVPCKVPMIDLQTRKVSLLDFDK